MANRVRDLKLLSRERWEAHVAAQAAEGTRVGAVAGAVGRFGSSLGRR